MDFKDLKESMNHAFTNILKLITPLSDLNEKEINEMISFYESFSFHIKDSIKNVQKEFEKIKDMFFNKISKLSIEKLKEEVDGSMLKFMEFADDLEILSLNTVCKTKKLGQERVVIFYISDEIKKSSDYVKLILKKIRENFYSIYDSFYTLIKGFQSVRDIRFTLQDKEGFSFEIVWNSDISDVVRYSQFHDIFKQQVEALEKAYFSINWGMENSAVETGKKKKFCEKSIPILIQMKNEIIDVLREMMDSFKGFIIEVKKDIEDMYGKVELFLKSFKELQTSEKKLFEDIEELTFKINELKNKFKTGEKLIEELLRFKRNFYNLRVVANVEVNRFNLIDLYSLTDSMDVTYTNLLGLIDKVVKTSRVWSDLTKEIEDIVEETHTSLSSYQKLGDKKLIKDIEKKSTSIINTLNRVKEMVEKDFIGEIKSYEKILIEKIEYFISLFRKEQNLISKLDFSILNNDEFRKGYDMIEIEIVGKKGEYEADIELF